MKYYVASDIHSYFAPFQDALREAGYFSDKEPHRLLLLGDLFDRGEESVEVQRFLCEELQQGRLILVRGNHEDLFEILLDRDGGLPNTVHLKNGTYKTALHLCGMTPEEAVDEPGELCRRCRETPFMTQLLPAMERYYETEHYIFVHGFLPCTDGVWKEPLNDWRMADEEHWRAARWINGMEMSSRYRGEKTVVCGHWHASYGHSVIEGNGPEFGPRADFSPFYGRKVIGIDACTACSGKVNVLVLEDTDGKTVE